MTKPNLTAIVSTLHDAGIPPRLGPDLGRLLGEAWRRVAEGHPVPVSQLEEVAAELKIPGDNVTTIINRMSERDGEGNVVGTFGLSQKKHPHQFEVNGHVLSTWCAWDALFLPALLGKTAHVESPCPATKETVRLTITPEKVESYAPRSAAISIVLPKTTKSGPESVQEIWGALCHHVHFFKTPEVATEWFAGKNLDPIMLSVEDGFDLGRMAFEELLSSPSSGGMATPGPIGEAATASPPLEVETCCEFHPPVRCGPTKCPSCGTLSRPVQRLTVGALLRPERRADIPHQDEFCLCRTADCDVVYFRPAEALFRKDDLTVRVHQKELDDPTVPVCYCFGWTPEKIRAEIESTGKSAAFEQITAEVKADNCYCEVTNPQGSCCLGNVSRVGLDRETQPSLPHLRP